MTHEFEFECFPTLPKEIENLLENIDTNGCDLSKLELTDKRNTVLLNILKGNEKIDQIEKIDIQLFVLKKLYPEKHKLLSITEHMYSKTDLYEYDPTKNGQNIMKHGISFREVVSYSNNFGKLILNIEHKDDDFRRVIFSTLTLKDETFKNAKEWELHLPLSNGVYDGDKFTLSIVTSVNSKFRFISSRVINEEKLTKSIRQSVKNAYGNDENEKRKFALHCEEILNRKYNFMSEK